MSWSGSHIPQGLLAVYYKMDSFMPILRFVPIDFYFSCVIVFWSVRSKKAGDSDSEKVYIYLRYVDTGVFQACTYIHIRHDSDL